jgi:hypothetical protein
MLYREVGQYKTSYAADMAVFPILQDRIGIGVILLVAFVVIPLIGNDFLLQAVMIPFLIFSLAAIGLNLLTGYTGLLSLGTGAFMGVGAYACLKLTTYFPQVNIVIWIIASGFFSAAVGVLFGLPSLRIKGFYLAVATLAAQFFLEWCFIRIPWLYNYAISGAIEVPKRTLAGIPLTGPTATATTRYLVVLSIVVLMTWVASNLVHGRIGRMWMAVRDMDLAAELIGIRPLVRRRRSQRFRDRPEFSDPVHGDHRRTGHADGIVLRRRADLHFADRAADGTGSLRPTAVSRDRGAPPVFDTRRPDYCLSGGRAERPGAALANRQAKTAGMAVSLLDQQACDKSS